MNMSTKIEQNEPGIAGSPADGSSKAADRSGLREHAIEHCKDYMGHRSQSEKWNLSELVQFVTLNLSLHYLFPGQSLQRPDTFEDILLIERRINELWIESKAMAKGGQRPNWKDESALHEALRRAMATWPDTPAEAGIVMRTANAGPVQLNTRRRYFNMPTQNAFIATLLSNAQEAWHGARYLFTRLLRGTKAHISFYTNSRSRRSTA
jgi:hypothetical protein